MCQVLNLWQCFRFRFALNFPGNHELDIANMYKKNRFEISVLREQIIEGA